MNTIKKLFSQSIIVKKLCEIVTFKREMINSIESEERYLGLVGVESHTGELSGIDEIASGQAFVYKSGDILYGRLRPYLNKVLLTENDGICSTEFHVMRIIDTAIVLPEFLAAVLRSDLVLSQTKHMMTGNTHPRISNDDVRNLFIPIPEIDWQRNFVEKLYSVRNKKRDQLKQADTIRESILAEFIESLNIKIPKIKSALIAVLKMQQVNATATRRLDPKCYDKKFQAIREELNNTIYPTYRLKDLIIDNVSGDWGYDEANENDTRIKCLVLRATEISNKNNITIRADKAQYRQIEKKKLAVMNLEIGDIIIEKSGGSIDQPVGRVIFVDRLEYNGYPLAYSNFLTKIKINRDLVDPYYLFEYLRFVYRIGLTEVMQNQTNGIRNLIIEEYLEQTVIVPKNNYEIGQKMYQLRSKASYMDLDAEQEWQTAKIQFEKELLGV